MCLHSATWRLLVVVHWLSVSCAADTARSPHSQTSINISANEQGCSAGTLPGIMWLPSLEHADQQKRLNHGALAFFQVVQVVRMVSLGNADLAMRPAAHNLGNCHGTGEIVPFVNRTFERAVVIATLLSVLSLCPRHCARLTCFLHPKLRKINAVLTQPAFGSPSVEPLQLGPVHVSSRRAVSRGPCLSAGHRRQPARDGGR